MVGIDVARAVALVAHLTVHDGLKAQVLFGFPEVAGVMPASLFEGPENPTEEEMNSNVAVAVALALVAAGLFMATRRKGVNA